jgi:hypothetical protein
MILSKSKTANVNYLAQIVEIKEFTKHINPKVERLKVAHVQGYDIIVGIDEQPGKYVYFPSNSTINPNLLSYANLYRHGELNANPEKTGFFEDNGRVKAIRLQNQVSEGFLLPLETMQSFILASVNVELPDDVCTNGLEFDQVEHAGKVFWINRKYVVHTQHQSGSGGGSNKRNKKLKRFDTVIEDQFRFHYDTVLLRKNPYVISPDNLISITSKWHGTSGISANVKCRRPLSWREKIAQWIARRKDLFNDYNNLYSSRSVIKNQFIYKGRNAHSKGFYNIDVWKLADDVLKPLMPKGMSLYYEICGYLPNGSYIQKDYDYGCVPPSYKATDLSEMKEGDYVCGKNFKIMVYRITMTNVDGIVHEFSAKEVQDWCNKKGLTPVIELYYGKAKDLYPELNTESENWSVEFMEHMANDKRFHMEQRSPDCSNNVPHEGIVIKIEDGIPRAWKLKCFAFLNKEQEELDKGISNIEDDAQDDAQDMDNA